VIAMKRLRRPIPIAAATVALLVALLLMVPGTPAGAAAAAPGTPAPTVAPKDPPPGPTATAKPPTAGPTPTNRAGGAATATPVPAPAGSIPPYDPKRDKGCGDCGPNGRAEAAGDRVARWADDCRKAGGTNCAADSVQRLYSEYQAQGKDWAASGYAAPPDMAGSQHNCPDYWAGQAKGCVADGSAAGGGGGGSGGTDSGAGFGFSPGGLARAVLGALDWKILLGGFVNGLWNLLVGDGFERDAGQIAGLLLVNPNLTDGGTPQMRTIQALVDDLRAAGVGLALLVLTVQVLEGMAGAGAGLGGVVMRAVMVVAALGFYRTLVGELLGAIDALTRGILTVGGDTVSAEFGGILRSLGLLTIPFWRVVALAGLVFIVAIGVVKVIGLVLLLLLYAAGPVLLPLAIHPRGAAWVGTWAEHFVKILIWPALFAFEFRVFGALGAGISFTGAQGNVDLVQGGLGVVVALASLLVILVTPWGCHTQFTAARAIQIVRDHRRAATAERPGLGRPAAGRDERGGTVRSLVGDTAAAAATPPTRTLRRIK